MFSNHHQLVEYLKNSLRIARSQNYRVMLVLAGDANQHRKVLCQAFLETEFSNSEHSENSNLSDVQNMTSSTDYIMHVPDRHSNSDVSDEINALLGKEHRCLVFNAQNTFNERLFAAAVGTVTAGGLLILQTPPLHSWAAQQDIAPDINKKSLFMSRLCEKLVFHHSLNSNISITKSGCPPALHDIPANIAFFIATPPSQSTGMQHCLIQKSNQAAWLIEQNCMLKLLVENLQNNAQSVSVVLGDRGRGKSTLIGRALNQLMATESMQSRPVSITASRRSACDVLLKQARHTIPFIPIDKAISEQHGLLIVEEAGSIPIPVLVLLLEQSRSIIFATTVQGYEGAGRGFALRFAKKLDTLKPGWLKLNPTSPIRWSEGDPLEAFVNDALLLKTSLSTIDNPGKLSTEHSHVSLMDKRALAADDNLLDDVYGLLVQAHYQTTPADLRNLLDQMHLLLFAQYTGQVLTGAALVAIEGEIPQALHLAIMRKQRRLPDQLLPQLLAQSSGESSVLQERFARVVRIAVHPAIQNRGFGTHLFRQLRKQLTANQFDFTGVNAIGASFGADQNTLSFWLKQGLKPIHYGYKSNPRSALRAACLMQSTHPTISQSIDKAGLILQLNSQALLSANRMSDPVQKQLLRAGMPITLSRLSEFDQRRLIHDFCLARRSFVDTVGLILNSGLFNDAAAVHETLCHMLNDYRAWSPNARRAAETRLRSALLETGLLAEFD